MKHPALAFVLVVLCAATAPAADWPQWRCDAEHSASSPENLPDTLHPQWTRAFSPRRQAWQDPINDAKLDADGDGRGLEVHTVRMPAVMKV